LHYVLRQAPFTHIHLKDEDVKADLAALNGPEDRLAIVVTEPLTTNEQWTAMVPGQLTVFVEGTVASCSTLTASLGAKLPA
jgi:predicted glutamine amidotransferase